MTKIDCLIAEINNNEFEEAFLKLYGAKSGAQQARYIKAVNCFKEIFPETEIALFSAPGRTEIGGNHTDHQHGCVLAAAVDLDVIAVVSPNSDNVIRVKSEGYEMNVVDLASLIPNDTEKGTSNALIRGVAAKFKELGSGIGGFNAYTTSNVLKGSGLSSSAAFEVLICAILNSLYNDGKMSAVEMAIVSQYAENIYFDKPCGLMDQTASSVGGFVGIDFNDPSSPIIEKVDFDFADVKHTLCIVDTGGNHADLTNEYASIPVNMKAVATYFNKTVLRDVDIAAFYKNMAAVRENCGDRAVLRAMHFFSDNQRAIDEKVALQNGDFNKFLSLINKSGRSSQTKLQNIFAASAPTEQGLSIALALSEKILGGRGAFRVHGGGFAGTIQAFVPNDLLDNYKEQIEAVFGDGSCYILSVRSAGGIRVEKESL